jgi:argininosuccinate lyase
MSLMAKTAAAGGGTLLAEVLAFTSSLSLDRALAREDLIGSMAHVVMLGRTGIVPTQVAAALRNALADLYAEAERGELTLAASEEDVHMAIEARLSSMCPAEAPRLHTGRSRNDQVALTLRLHVRAQCIEIEHGILNLVSALVDRAESTEGTTEFPSFTHRQRAQPIRVGYWCLAYASMFMRDAEGFAAALEEANECPLGSGAIAGSTLPLDRDLVSDLLLFRGPTRNALDTVGDRDFAIAYAYACARLLGHGSRLATDIIDFATSEFGFVKLDDAIACGSSMMPQKKNPDLFELVRGKSARAIGNLTTLLVLMKGLPGGYNRDQQEDRQVLLETGPLAISVAEMLQLGIAHIRFDADRCQAALASDMTQATDLAEALVKRGVPFRVAYQAVGKLVRYAMTERISLADVPPAVARQEHAEFAHPEVLACLQALGATTRKFTKGSTGPAAMAEQVSQLRARIATRRESLQHAPKLARLHAAVLSAKLAAELG